MSTAEATNKKRKVIDLDENTFRVLSIKAASAGTNLKAMIEEYLKEVAEDFEDSAVYTYLSNSYSKGKVMLDDNEKKDFENWLGV